MIKQFATTLFSTSKQKCLSKILGIRFQSTDYSPICEGLIVEPKDQALWIKFDRPKKFNAISGEMYECITNTLNKVNQDKSIKVVVLTGNGDYYSSGNDLTNFMRAMQDDGGLLAGLAKSRDILERFVNSLINLEKFFVAAVNGPAVGIAASTLPLTDYVIASSKATFSTPFTALGMCPEACSSLTFPQIMGASRANELLMLNKTWDSNKAQTYGLVSDVVDPDKFHSHLDNLLYGKQGIIKTCYPHAMKITKSLIKDQDTKRKLTETNKRECDAIVKLWAGEECADAVQKFFARSK